MQDYQEFQKQKKQKLENEEKVLLKKAQADALDKFLEELKQKTLELKKLKLNETFVGYQKSFDALIKFVPQIKSLESGSQSHLEYILHTNLQSINSIDLLTFRLQDGTVIVVHHSDAMIKNSEYGSSRYAKLECKKDISETAKLAILTLWNHLLWKESLPFTYTYKLRAPHEVDLYLIGAKAPLDLIIFKNYDDYPMPLHLT